MPSHLLHEKETFFGWRSMAFQKLIFYHFLDKFFLRTFLLNNWILQKNFNFCKFAIFLQILKVEDKSFPMMYHLSYLDIKHGIQRRGQIDPPPRVSWFSSTPAGIGLNQITLWCHYYYVVFQLKLKIGIQLCTIYRCKVPPQKV